MSERWTFLVVAEEPGGPPVSIRVTLEDRDVMRQSTIEVAPDGTQQDVTDVPHDYEAPEWKAGRILQEGGVADPDAYLDALKTHLRAAVAEEGPAAES